MKLLITLVVVSVVCGVYSQTAENDFEPVAPFFDAQRDVRFLLNTRQNLGASQVLNFNDITSLRNSNFRPARPTRILIHGFQEGEEANINVETSR